jgi:predicted RNase H-like nuclease (RuvC/YqgF family)
MKTVHLAFTVAAVLAAVASGVLYLLIGNQKESLRQELATANGRINVLDARSTDLGSQRDVLEAQARALEDQLAESKARGVSFEARATQLSRELQQMSRELAEKIDGEQTQQRELAQLRRDLVQARSALLEQGSQAEVAALQGRIDTLEAELAARGSGPRPPLGRTVQITTVTSPRDFGIHTASVLNVGTKSAFVVLNIGSAHGARPGLQLAVDRQGLSLARLQISEVNENYSIAQVEAGSLTGRLRVGDNATILN